MHFTRDGTTLALVFLNAASLDSFISCLERLTYGEQKVEPGGLHGSWIDLARHADIDARDDVYMEELKREDRPDVDDPWVLVDHVEDSAH